MVECFLMGLGVHCVLTSFPGLTHVLLFVCNTRKSGKKQGRSGNTYHMNGIRWTRGGRRRGGIHIQITCWTSSSSTPLLGRTSYIHRWRILSSASVFGRCLPMPTSRLSCVPSPSPFSPFFHFLCIILNVNWKTKQNKETTREAWVWGYY